MRVSSGGSDAACRCASWEGTLLSVSGKTKGLPTYEQAKAGGCFHPNCAHTLEAVDEYADAEEIALAKAHPFRCAKGEDVWEAQDERKYEIDQAVKMRDGGLSREQARAEVDRDNLAAAIRTGLISENAKAIVSGLTDSQIAEICKDGNPPAFVPFKAATKKDLAVGASEKWNHGKQ